MASNSRRTNQSSSTSLRKEQLSQVSSIVSELENSLEVLSTSQKKLALFESVSTGLYEEVDKLTKKAPAESVTDLMLDQVNDIIRETKELLSDDPYVQRLNVFVPAGDNPQLRDVVVVLRQLRQGMQRNREHMSTRTSKCSSLLQIAITVKTSLEYYVKNSSWPEISWVRQMNGSASDGWFKYILGDNVFNGEKLDHTNLAEYFRL